MEIIPNKCFCDCGVGACFFAGWGFGEFIAISQSVGGFGVIDVSCKEEGRKGGWWCVRFGCLIVLVGMF